MPESVMAAEEVAEFWAISCSAEGSVGFDSVAGWSTASIKFAELIEPPDMLSVVEISPSDLSAMSDRPGNSGDRTLDTNF